MAVSGAGYRMSEQPLPNVLLVHPDEVVVVESTLASKNPEGIVCGGRARWDGLAEPPSGCARLPGACVNLNGVSSGVPPDPGLA